MHDSVLTAVALVDVIAFESDGIDSVQFALNEYIIGLCAVVDVAVAVVIVHFEAENKAVSAFEPVRKEFILQQVGNSVP
jgi:hypothetical protein